MFGLIGQHRKNQSLHGIMSSWACTSAVQCSVVGGHDDNRNSRNTGTVIIQCQGETFQRDQRTELCSKRKIDRHPITMVRQFFKFTSPASPGIILLRSCTPCSHPSLIIRSEWQWTGWIGIELPTESVVQRRISWWFPADRQHHQNRWPTEEQYIVVATMAVGA